jgi:hypothetical protein
MAETEIKTEHKKPLFWGPEHDIFYANAFHLRVSDNDISIELGTMQNISNVDGMLSTHQVIMTFKSAKLLSIVLSHAISALEGRFGEIKIDAEKIASLETVLDEGSKKILGK